MGAVAAIAGAVGTVVSVFDGANQRTQQRNAIEAQRKAADERALLEQYAAISNQQAALQSAKLANLQLYNQSITDLQKLDVAGQQALAEQASKVAQIDAFITQQRLGVSAATAEGVSRQAQIESKQIAAQMELYQQEVQQYSNMAKLNGNLLTALQNKDATGAAEIAKQLVAVSQASKPGGVSGQKSVSDKNTIQTYDRLAEIRTAEQMLQEQGAIDTSKLNQGFVDELKVILGRIGDFEKGSLQQQGNLNLSAATIAANAGLDALTREGVANDETLKLLRQIIPIDYQVKAGQNLIDAQNSGNTANSNIALSQSTNRATQAQLDAQAPRGNILTDIGTIIGGVAPVIGLFQGGAGDSPASASAPLEGPRSTTNYSVDNRFKFSQYDRTPVTSMLNLLNSSYSVPTGQSNGNRIQSGYIRF